MFACKWCFVNELLARFLSYTVASCVVSMRKHTLKNGQTIVAHFPKEKHMVVVDSDSEEYTDTSQGKGFLLVDSDELNFIIYTKWQTFLVPSDSQRLM